MARANQRKRDKGKGGVNPVVAAGVGAVVGAGVAVAGAVALKDKKNRDKVRKALTNVKDQAVDYVEDMQRKAQDEKGKVEKKLAKGKQRVKKVVKAAKKAARTK